MNKKGFTLIELLVVIAIIGILSSIAIVYLSDARNKANDAKVKSNVTTAATQVELDRANGTNPTAGESGTIEAIIGKLGTAPCGTAAYLYNNSTDANLQDVAIYSDLCTTGNEEGDIFCADSQGFRGQVTAVPVLGKCQP